MKRVLTFVLAASIGLVGGSFEGTALSAQETTAGESASGQPERPAAGRGGQRGREQDGRGQQGRGQRGGQQGRGMRGREQAPTPVPIVDGKAKLSPQNTKVNFIGKHEGDDPKPRLGGFGKFKGELMLADDGASLGGLTMEFETASLWTELGGDLTSHLKNEDFLDVEKFPSAKFVSTSVSAGVEGALKVVGDFTLMGKTNEITIPVKLTQSEQGVMVTGELTLDRAEFGMNKMLDRVSKEVEISLSVGERTFVPGAGGRGPGGPGGRGGRGGLDLEAFFKNQDADGDGRLTGEEIPERMKAGLERIDTDKDGSISLEEIKAMMERRQGGGGGRGPGGRGTGGQGGQGGQDGR